MIAIDTNILVYAHREDSPWHGKALAGVTGLAGEEALVGGSRFLAISGPGL